MNDNFYSNFGSFIATTIIKCLMKTQEKNKCIIAYASGFNTDELKEGQIDYDSYRKILSCLGGEFCEPLQWLSCLNSCLNLVSQKEQKLQQLLEYSEEFIQNIQAKDVTIKGIIDFFEQSYTYRIKQYNEKFIFDIYRKNSEAKNELNLDVSYIYVCFFCVILKCLVSTEFEISALKQFN
ncbi:hypothetical protein AB9V25_001487 [Campylobacter lari]|uniref:hypothetical protein n=1 Tax=Campylobacter lari TaxID=201 RepID=UPI00215255F4|nr:hypothetical protein [Campylobacter lari]MCR6536636.1 hypothetical protein [Campylobacter lari]